MQSTSTRKRTWKEAREGSITLSDKLEKSESGKSIKKETMAGTSPQPVQLYSLHEEVEGQLLQHSVLHIASTLGDSSCVPAKETYNIFMGDASGSMSSAWDYVVSAWNQHVACNLTGKTDIYVFDTELTFVREGTELKDSDYTGGGTNLCLALSTIRDKVKECKEQWVRVFIITDGAHNATEECPEDVIQTLATPPEKTCEVYLLGVGGYFPVKYSVEIRSRLHNGSANMPTLFWAKKYDDILGEAKDMEIHLKESKVPVKLSLPGSLVPGLEETNEFHLGEYVYMSCVPDSLKSVQVSTEENEVDVPLEALPLTIDIFLSSLLPQWNSVLIQRHSMKKTMPNDVFPFTERVFNYLYSQVVMPKTESTTIHTRLAQKKERELKVRFQTLVNQSKTILTTEKFMSEMALAEAILLTTVTTRKHAVKGLKLKGHTEENYAEDCRAFMDTYTKIKERLNDIQVSPEDCCRVTMTSTISDLKDEDFPELLKLNKFEFLKTFSMSGIPVFSRSRDSTELNPWSFKIDRILTSPFSVLSQVAMEEFAHVEAGAVGKDKEVRLQQDNKESGYNAVVPVFSSTVAKILKPLVCTNLYAMCATFALLKNPHIIDYTIHLAGLGATWIKTLADYPVASERPEFAKERLESVEATAMIYLGRPSLALYLKELQATPRHALMTECPQEDPEAKPLRCEAILKPLFLMHLTQRAGRPFDHQVKVSIMRLASVEFLGRCLHHTAHDPMPFINCFMKDITEEEKRKEWIRELFKNFSVEILKDEVNLQNTFYFPEEIVKYVMKLLKKKREAFLQVVCSAVKPEVTGLEKLHSVHNCGDVTWKHLQVCAVELGLSDSEVKEVFSEKNALIYIYHVLTHTSSSERMKEDLLDYDMCLEKVKSKLTEEVMGCARMIIQEEVQSAFLKQWYEAYDSCHGGDIIIRPMARQEIVEEAKSKGIDVSNETFDKVYLRYNEKLGLLRNACQSPSCPFYLHANRSFNQHIKCERRPGRFLHRLNQVASGEEDLATKVELIKFCTSNTNRVSPELLDIYQGKLQELSSVYKKWYLER
ncbi:uncharacterized protein LOC143027641 [Oratosquilla oratoria]|uniref:uncharacterized protein LOC143027641 n=1 Tax=Oratosquilla oratoria TaxID=337810 RepID=UPI003F766428